MGQVFTVIGKGAVILGVSVCKTCYKVGKRTLELSYKGCVVLHNNLKKYNENRRNQSRNNKRERETQMTIDDRDSNNMNLF